MELLSFTYIFIELIFVAVAVYGLWVSWWTVLVGLLGLAFYPIIYEVLLKIIFRIKFWTRATGTAHSSRHLDQQRTNGLLYHPLFNLGMFSWSQFKGLDLNKSEHVLNGAIDRRPDFDFAFTFRANEPDYAVIYRFLGLSQLIFLNYSAYLSYVFDQMWFWVPGVALRLAILRKFMFQVQGTINGVCLAIEKGFAINLGGGMHHASTHSSCYFCPYNDIGVAIQYLWHFHPESRNVLIIDLDAHQGNGHARDKQLLLKGESLKEEADQMLVRKRIHILDLFNSSLPIPNDPKAKELIDTPVEVGRQDSDESYLSKLQGALERVRGSFIPNFIIYNAGADILMGDLTGQMGITARGLKLRDEMVFNFAREQRAPVLMLLSGGWSPSASAAIAESIVNLTEKFPGLRYNTSHVHSSGPAVATR